MILENSPIGRNPMPGAKASSKMSGVKISRLQKKMRSERLVTSAETRRESDFV
jgi:hypothetical protein